MSSGLYPVAGIELIGANSQGCRFTRSAYLGDRGTQEGVGVADPRRPTSFAQAMSQSAYPSPAAAAPKPVSDPATPKKGAAPDTSKEPAEKHRKPTDRLAGDADAATPLPSQAVKPLDDAPKGVSAYPDGLPPAPVVALLEYAPKQTSLRPLWIGTSAVRVARLVASLGLAPALPPPTAGATEGPALAATEQGAPSVSSLALPGPSGPLKSFASSPRTPLNLAAGATGAGAPAASLQSLSAGKGWMPLGLESLKQARVKGWPQGPSPSATVDWAAAQCLAPAAALTHTNNLAAAPASASLALAPDAPEFPAAVAQQLITWSNAGVQGARIHLHPAELGPIAIAISLQEGGARVDFAVASAQTRQALQDSLPQLAQLFQEAGMSLLGANVSARQGGSQAQTPLRNRAPILTRARESDVQALATVISPGAPPHSGWLDLYV